MEIYLHEDGLQLAAVLPTVALGEEHLVGRDAVIRHPAIPLEHPDNYIRQTVLGLTKRMIEKGKDTETLTNARDLCDLCVCMGDIKGKRM